MLGILNRLKIWQKLLMVGIFFTVPLVFAAVLFLKEAHYKINFARFELDGDTYLRPCASLLEHLGRHQVLQRRLLKGDTSLKAQVADTEAAVDRDLHELDAVDAQLGAPDRLDVSLTKLIERERSEGALPVNLKKNWEKAKAAATQAASDELHAAMLHDVNDLISSVGDTSKLILTRIWTRTTRWTRCSCARPACSPSCTTWRSPSTTSFARRHHGARAHPGGRPPGAHAVRRVQRGHRLVVDDQGERALQPV